MPREVIPSRTLGIDLASQPKDTAACLIDWTDTPARVALLRKGGWTDDALLELMQRESVSRVGIDAPFGWPAEFIDALVGYRSDGAWPLALDDHSGRSRLALRETDREVRRVTAEPNERGQARHGKTPLSVSTDKIAYTAMRSAGLLAGYAQRSGNPLDRSGGGRVVEVYPDAALREWGFLDADWDAERRGYKGVGERAQIWRQWLARRISRELDGVIELSDGDQEACELSDDALDALVCALVARAVDLDHSRPIPPDALGRAREEGWIHLPTADSLKRLGG